MRWFVAILALAAAVSTPALAQGEIPRSSGRNFEHEQTGITFPRRLVDLPRVGMDDHGSQQFDVVAHYEDSDRDNVLTVYLYRAGLNDASIAFDVLLPTMTAREGMRASNLDGLAVTSFSPPHSATASGLRVSYAPEGDTSTTANAAMIFPHGYWLVKVRFTSSTLDPAAADGLLDRMLAELDLPDPRIPSRAAHRIGECATPASFADAEITENGTDDRQVVTTALSVMLTSMTFPRDELPETALDVPQPITWCRQSNALRAVSIYRPNAREDAYVIALNDAGVGLSVGSWIPGLFEISQEIELRTPVVEANSDGVTVLGLFNGTPSPQQIETTLQRGRRLAHTDRVGSIEIDQSLMAQD